MSSGPPSRAVRFARNTGWNLLGQFGLAALSLMLIPYIIKKLGTGGYALYSLMGIIASYLMLLTLGAGPATIKFVSESVGGDNRKALGTTLGTSLWLHGGLVALGSLAVLAFSGRLTAGFFNIPPDLRYASVYILACAAAGAVFFSLFQYGLSILQGLQRYDLVNIVNLLQSGIFLCGVALLLWSGLGMRSIGALYVLVQGSLCALCLFLALRLMPVSPSWAFWRRSAAGDNVRFMTYGLGLFVSQLAWSVAFQWDKLFIAHYLPMAQLTYYLIPSAILQKFWILPSTLSATAFPMFSELHGRGEHVSIKSVYRKGSQLVLWAVVPGFVFLMVLAPQFLTLWLGESFSSAGTWPLRLLLAGYFIHFMTAMAVSATQGIGRIRYSVGANIALAVLCCVSWMILIPKYGIAGAAAGFLLAKTCSDVPFLLITNKKLFGMTPLSYFESICLRPFAAGAALLLALWLLRFQLFTWPLLILLVGVSVLFYYGLGYWLLDEEGRRTLAHLVESFLKKKKQAAAVP